MKFLYAKASPFARKVSVALIEKDLLEQVEFVETTASPVEANPVLNHENPLGKLPCLVLDNGDPVFDSRVILRHLDTLSDKSPLYPNSGDSVRRLTFEAACEGIMDAAILCVYEHRFRDEGQRSETFLRGQQSKIASTLTWIEGHYDEAIGPEFDCVALSLACALGYLDFRKPVPDWRPENPRLASWFGETSKRPSLVRTMPE